MNGQDVRMPIRRRVGRCLVVWTLVASKLAGSSSLKIKKFRT
jgi:hypothetical protein